MSRRPQRLGFDARRKRTLLNDVRDTIDNAVDVMSNAVATAKRRYKAIDTQVTARESRGNEAGSANKTTRIDLTFDRLLPALPPQHYNLLSQLEMDVSVINSNNAGTIRLYLPEGDNIDIRKLAMDICSAVGWVLKDFTPAADRQSSSHVSAIA